jgi:hypothetical protein
MNDYDKFTLEGVSLITNLPGDYAVVINVRGVESVYNLPSTMFVSIQEDIPPFDAFIK